MKQMNKTFMRICCSAAGLIMFAHLAFAQSGGLSLRSFTLKGFGEVNFKKGKIFHEGGTIELIVLDNRAGIHS